MKKYGYHEVRHMHWDSLRALCIKENWCTNASSDQYKELLDMTETENITTDDIVEMATLIMEYSGMSIHGDDFSNVCFNLFQICNTFIEED